MSNFVFLFLWKSERILGQVPKWLNGADCKSAGLRPTEVRTLPCPPTSSLHCRCGSSSVGRASAFQAEGREFESRLPLKRFRRLPRRGVIFLEYSPLV